jgi:flagella basal body P-ring formation protein FlgA
MLTKLFRAALAASTLLAGQPVLAQQAGDAPRLKALITVEADTIRLGDLIEGAGQAGNRVVFRAPEPGQSGTIRADRVAAAARDHGITGLDTQALQAVTVRRTGRTVTAQEIAAAVSATLRRDHGIAADTEVELLAGTTEFIVEADAGAAVTVASLAYNATQQRFEATLTVPGSTLAQRLQPKVIGGVTDISRVPRLTRGVLRGETITADHLTFERRRRSELPLDLVTDPERIVDQVARRTLAAGQILRESDMARRELVERNATVLMLYEQPGMTLSLRGKALAGGAAGDTVQVQNLQSKKIIEAMVVGSNRVRVLSASDSRTEARLQSPGSRTVENP